MPEKKYITRNIVLDPETLRAVEELIEERGLAREVGFPRSSGYSEAIRAIITEWRAMRKV
jgi:hypothetical protein